MGVIQQEKVWNAVKSVLILSFQFLNLRISKMVHKIGSLDELNSQLASAGDKLVVIDFFATWCGPCKMIAPKLEEWSASMPNVVFLKVDVDEAEDVAAEYSIQAMPTFIFMKNKSKVGDLCGANADKLKELITTHAK